VQTGHAELLRVATIRAENQAAQTETAKAIAHETPSIGADLPTPAVLMFCVGLQQAGDDGPGKPIAVVPDGARVVYQPHSCEPDVDASGSVAIRAEDGSIARVTPAYTTAAVSTPNNIVWTPALGDLNGTPTVMTAKFIKNNAQVQFDQLGQPVLITDMSGDGEKIFGSLTTRIGNPESGLPLAMFLDGMPLRDAQRTVLAPRVASEITTTLEITGLSRVDAVHLVSLLNSGKLQ
jgi:hypothetical protein